MVDGPVAILLPKDLPGVCVLVPALLRLHAAQVPLRLHGPAWALDLLAGIELPILSRAAALAGARLALGHGLAAAWAARRAGVPGHGGGAWLARRLWRSSDLVKILGNLPPAPPLPPASRHGDEAAAALAEAGISGRFTIVSPRVLAGTRGREGSWPAYPLLMRLLSDAGRRVVALPGGGDPAAIHALLPEAILLPGLGSGATAALTARAEVVVSDDEGIIHLSGLSGAALVALARHPLPGVSGPRVTTLAQDRWATAAQVWTAMERLR